MAEDDDKRTGTDRREKPDRRINADPNHIYVGPDKRNGLDRRTGKDRREKQQYFRGKKHLHSWMIF